MKNYILLIFTLYLSTALNAQDTTASCQKLTNLLLLQKDKKQAVRMISKSSKFGAVTIVEQDTLANIHTWNTMNTARGEMKNESIIYCDKYYLKNEGQEWLLIKMDSLTLKTMKISLTTQQKQNMLPHNCQQLQDEIISGEKCVVYTSETEYQFPKTEGGKVSTKAKSKIWLSEQGSVKKMEMEIYLNGEKITSQVTYEYDSKILIVEPKIKPR